jgi:hypothetical protein
MHQTSRRPQLLSFMQRLRLRRRRNNSNRVNHFAEVFLIVTAVGLILGLTYLTY